MFRANLEETGMGYHHEVDLIAAARSLDLLTTPYVFNPEEARLMAAAGADIIVAHMGLTTGGTIGAATAKTLVGCVDEVQQIIDAAFHEFGERGLASARLDDIAKRAGVAKGTIYLYFPNKEAVIVALMEETSEYVAEALARQPRDITEHEALVRAHTEVFRAAEKGQVGETSFDRIHGFLSIVNSTPMLSLASFTFQPGSANTVGEAIAHRMGLPVTDPAVRIVYDTWAVLMATALGIPGSDASDPRAVSDRIEETFALFARLWQPWAPADQPPAGEHGR
jgi:AcrR family transcriptional regulator